MKIFKRWEPAMTLPTMRIDAHWIVDHEEFCCAEMEKLWRDYYIWFNPPTDQAAVTYAYDYGADNGGHDWTHHDAIINFCPYCGQPILFENLPVEVT